MVLRRDAHLVEVCRMLEREFPGRTWELSLPSQGTGNETYFGRCAERSCFIKLGVEIERYRIMDSLGLAPRVILTGCLEDGTALVVQERVEGRKPSRKDFRDHLEHFAQAVRAMHESEGLKRVLSPKRPGSYRDVGLDTLADVERRWRGVRLMVPEFAAYVESGIERLREEIYQFSGGGLVASHNDICNANWLVSSQGRVYLIDYEMMTMEDPALDLGAILWWYYPPELRGRFIQAAGYLDDEGLRRRMRFRMAVHNLNIILPRENSFDTFDVAGFEEALVDFKAVMEGKENPQGYGS